MMLDEAVYFQLSLHCLAIFSLTKCLFSPQKYQNVFTMRLIFFLVFAVMCWLEICLAYHFVEHILMLLLARIWSVKYPSE